MRGYTKATTAVVTLGLAVSMAACSSSGGGSDSSSTAPAGGNSSSSSVAAPATSSSAAAGGTAAATKAGAAPVGAFTTLTGKSTTVALAPSFLSALKSLGVTPAPVGKAKLAGANISFPITGGNAKIYKKGEVTPYVQGKVEHNGSGLSLSAGGTTVTLENFVIDPGSNSKLTGKVLVNGKVFAPSVRLFVLDGGTLKTPTISSAGVATLTGTTVYVSPEALGALNTAFKLTGSKKLPTTAKVEVGIATILATGK